MRENDKKLKLFLKCKPNKAAEKTFYDLNINSRSIIVSPLLVLCAA